MNVAAIFVALCLALAWASPVGAHSALLETAPKKGEVTDDPPTSLELRFNEPVEQALAHVIVYDWNGRPILTGQPDSESKRSRVLYFTLPDLEQGTYTVQWSIVSLDGHPVSGSYVFSVGKATEGGVQSVDTAAGGSTILLVAARFVVEGLLLVGAGLYWFAWMAERRKQPSIRMLWKKGHSIGTIFLIVGTLVEFAVYSAYLPAGLAQSILNGRWDLLLHFPFMLTLFAQLLFLILLLIPGMVPAWYLGTWLFLAAVPAFGGHVWGMEQPLAALVARIFHQLSIALWLGALSYLILLIAWKRKQGKEVASKEFRPFFVRCAMVASGLVVLSGIMMVFLQTGWKAIMTQWGGWSTMLLVKIGLIMLMLGIASFQTLKWRRRGTFSTARLIRVEWFAGFLAIFVGVWMSQIAYPLPVKSYESSLTSGQAEAEVKIDKLQAGKQTMIIRLPSLEQQVPERVSVEMSMPDHGMEAGVFVAEETRSGEYEVELPFTMPGGWNFIIRAEYAGGEEEKWEDDVFIAGEGNGG